MSDPCPSYSCCCLPAHLTASSIDCGHSPLPVQYFMLNTIQDQVWDYLFLKPDVGLAPPPSYLSYLLHPHIIGPWYHVGSFQTPLLPNTLWVPWVHQLMDLCSPIYCAFDSRFQKQKYIKKKLVVIIISVLKFKRYIQGAFPIKSKRGELI